VNAAPQQNGKAVSELAIKGLAAAARLTLSYLEARARRRTGQSAGQPQAPQSQWPVAERNLVPREPATQAQGDRSRDTAPAPASPAPDPAVSAAMLASQQAQAHAWAARVYSPW
jgi:hypothetical protein